MGWEPIRSMEPPPAVSQRREYAAWEPEWLSSARRSSNVPPLASISRRSFATGGAYTKFSAYPMRDLVPATRVDHGVGVLHRLGKHRLPRHGARLGEAAGERLLHDEVLAGVGGVDGQRVVETRHHGQRHEVDILALQHRPMVGVRVGNVELPGKRLGALLGLGADRNDLALAAPDLAERVSVQLRREPRTDEANANLIHGRLSRRSPHSLKNVGRNITSQGQKAMITRSAIRMLM